MPLSVDVDSVLTGHVVPGWQAQEDATPPGPGFTYGSVGGLEFTVRATDETGFLADADVVATEPKLGTFTGYVTSVTTPGSIDEGLTARASVENVLAGLAVDRYCPPVGDGLLITSFGGSL